MSRHQSDTAVLEQVKVELPKKYAVVMLNDDFTPMEFVVEVLRVIFNMTGEKAEALMLQVHHQGRGVAGVYTREVAETKVKMTQDIAEMCGHPFCCIIEQI